MKFFLAQDGDCHWYLVNASNRNEWEAWLAIPEHEPAAWTPPAFAKELGRSVSCMEFESPTEKQFPPKLNPPVESGTK